jgi:hypothetical protein
MSLHKQTLSLKAKRRSPGATLHYLLRYVVERNIVGKVTLCHERLVSAVQVELAISEDLYQAAIVEPEDHRVIRIFSVGGEVEDDAVIDHVLLLRGCGVTLTDISPRMGQQLQDHYHA